MAWHPHNETPSPNELADTDALYERPADPTHEKRLDQLAEAEAWAERADQESRGIPWADGPDRTYEQMEKDDADFAARQSRRGRGEVEAEAEAEPDI